MWSTGSSACTPNVSTADASAIRQSCWKTAWIFIARIQQPGGGLSMRRGATAQEAFAGRNFPAILHRHGRLPYETMRLSLTAAVAVLLPVILAGCVPQPETGLSG